MRNKFPGICYRCGASVKTGEGHFERVSKLHFKKWGNPWFDSWWLTQHAECAIKYRNTSVHYKYDPVQLTNPELLEIK